MSDTFTVEQARTLIPWLQKTFDEMQPLIEHSTDIRRYLDEKSKLIRSNGGANAETDIIQSGESLQKIEGEINQMVASIVDLNVLVKNLQTGLFDFPYVMNGELVYLCWQAGEPDLLYWHTIDSGFAGRQSL